MSELRAQRATMPPIEEWATITTIRSRRVTGELREGAKRDRRRCGRGSARGRRTGTGTGWISPSASARSASASQLAGVAVDPVDQYQRPQARAGRAIRREYAAPAVRGEPRARSRDSPRSSGRSGSRDEHASFNKEACGQIGRAPRLRGREAIAVTRPLAAPIARPFSAIEAVARGGDDDVERRGLSSSISARPRSCLNEHVERWDRRRRDMSLATRMSSRAKVLAVEAQA